MKNKGKQRKKRVQANIRVEKTIHITADPQDDTPSIVEIHRKAKALEKTGSSFAAKHYARQQCVGR